MRFSRVVSCNIGKGGALDRGNYWGLKLMDWLLKLTERIIEKLTKIQINIDEMHFGFMPSWGTTDVVFVLRQM